MAKSKAEAYLGFCVRAHKIIFGTEMISRQKRGIYLLLADGGIGANSLKIMVKAKDTHSCPLFVTTGTGVLGEWLHRPAVKAVAILDEHLATAIIATAEKEEQIKFYSGGNN